MLFISHLKWRRNCIASGKVLEAVSVLKSLWPWFTMYCFSHHEQCYVFTIMNTAGSHFFSQLSFIDVAENICFILSSNNAMISSLLSSITSVISRIPVARRSFVLLGALYSARCISKKSSFSIYKLPNALVSSTLSLIPKHLPYTTLRHKVQLA